MMPHTYTPPPSHVSRRVIVFEKLLNSINPTTAYSSKLNKEGTDVKLWEWTMTEN